jgi:acid phosphatase type 7
LAASLTARAEAVAPLFADGFESGGLSAWTAVSGLAVQQQHVYAGAWAARGTTSGPGVYATKTLPATQPELYYRTYVKLISLGGTSSVNFMKFRTATGTAIAELYLTPAGLLGWRNDVTATSINSQTTVTTGVWHEAQMHLRVNGTASTVEVWLDGARVDALSTTTASLGTTPVGRVQLGENVTGRSYDFAYDDVAADTSYLSPAPTTTTMPATTTPTTTEPTTTSSTTTTVGPTTTTSSPTTTTLGGTPPLFADGFEAGDLSAWTVASGLAVQQQQVYAGAWAARGTTGGPGVYATKTLPAAQGELFYRIRVKLISLGGSSSVNFMKFRTATGTAIAELYVTPGGLLGYRNDVTAVSTTSQVILTAGVWYEAQVHLRVNGAASTVEVWLNGARVDALSTSTASLGTTAVGRIQLGENVAGRSYDFAYDDVVAGTSYVSSAPSPMDPVLAAAGDIACDPLDPHFNGGAGTANACRERFVSDLILADANIDAVAALGDVQYECGGLSAFQQSYEQSWGRVKGITRPAVGNHEYLPSFQGPATDCDPTGNAGGYFTYFGAAAGDPSQGYYSYDLGSWHIVVLNTTCEHAGGCDPGSPQEVWLRNDLASHPAACTLAYWHIPRWSSGGRGELNSRWFVQDLYNAGADVILAGHDHTYERFAPQNPNADPDPKGLRAFVVGTGGKNHTTLATPAANSEVFNADTYGILKLTLHPTSYDWQFVPEPGKTFTDTGSQACH